MKKLILTLITVLPCMVYALTHKVSQDGSSVYASIQAAINACHPGDSVLVYPGRYYENLLISTDTISLISLEAITGSESLVDSTVVDGHQMGAALRLNQGVHNIIIRGFSFTNSLGSGISIGPGVVAQVTNCKSMHNTSANGGGVSLAGSTVTFSGVDIFSNYALLSGGGLHASTVTGYVNNITFDPLNRCSIFNNRSSSGQDIYIQNAASNLNVYLDTFSVSEPTSYYAVYKSVGLNNFQMHLDFLNAHHREIDSDLYVSLDGDDANDGLSPATALKSINEAIYRIAADSLHQNTVHISSGVYSRSSNSQSFPIALKSWTIVKGSGIQETVIIGSPHPLISTGYLGMDLVFKYVSQDCVSLADMEITTENTQKGMAIFCSEGTSLNLRNLRIHDIKPNRLGVLNLYLNSRLESLWENVIVENDETEDYPWISIEGGISGRIVNCVFRNATQTSDSQMNSCPPLIKIVGSDRLSFENCIFSNLAVNACNTWVISVSGPSTSQIRNRFSFKNCLFSNLSSDESIMSVRSMIPPSLMVRNCTFSDNSGSGTTLSLIGNVEIGNCIFFNDMAYQIGLGSSSDEDEPFVVVIDHSLVSGGLNGVSSSSENILNYTDDNIDCYPLFRGGNDILDPLYYSLGLGSACINAGRPDTLGLFIPPYDLAGNWRVWDGCIDMGCFEYGAPPLANDDPTAPEISLVSLTAYPNPFRVYTSIKVNLSTGVREGTELVNTAHISIYNIKGQLVKTLELDTHKAGEQIRYWDGRDADNTRCSSGIYFVNLIENGRTVSTRKVTLIR